MKITALQCGSQTFDPHDVESITHPSEKDPGFTVKLKKGEFRYFLHQPVILGYTLKEDEELIYVADSVG